MFSYMMPKMKQNKQTKKRAQQEETHPNIESKQPQRQAQGPLGKGGTSCTFNDASQVQGTKGEV